MTPRKKYADFIEITYKSGHVEHKRMAQSRDGRALLEQVKQMKDLGNVTDYRFIRKEVEL